MKKTHLYLATALCFGLAGNARADEVKMTTGLQTGESLTLALNEGLKAKIVWGNGEEQTLEFDGSLKTLPVKDAGLTIVSTEGNITSLYVQGNRLSALDVAAAPGLKMLLAADNELTTLNLSDCKELVALDVQNNKLRKLDLNKQPELKDLNVANNALNGSDLRLSTAARLTYCVVAGNELTNVSTAKVMSEVKTYWLQHNNLTSLALGSSSSLRSLSASSNELRTLSLAPSAMLREVWVDNNRLTKLDLSKGSPRLETLAADHNQLTEVLWDIDCKSTCQEVYLNHNALFINSMPHKKSGARDVVVNYQPQEDYALEKYYDLDKTLDWSGLINRNGWDIPNNAVYTLTDRDGKQLVKGTDFTEEKSKFTFKVAHVGVVMKVENKYYTFQTRPFNVGTKTAIDHVTAENSLEVSAAPGTLTVRAAADTEVTVYAVSGAAVVRKAVTQGTHSWQLPAGVYVVNGKKVLVP